MAQMFTVAELIRRYPHLGGGLSPAEREILQRDQTQTDLSPTGLLEMAVTDGADTSPPSSEEATEEVAPQTERALQFIDPEC